MSESNEPCLDSFFIYNATLSSREGDEHKKILYYYPSSVCIDTKIKNIGLCEAVVQYVNTFTDGPCESLHTQNKRQLFYQPEADFWMIMTVTIPRTKKASVDSVDIAGAASSDTREDDVQDLVLGSILRRTYKVFKLFMGTYKGILEQEHGDIEMLKDKLQHFYNRHLLTLKLDQSDILDVYSGLSFMPLEKGMYLKTQCLINRLEAKFPQVKHTMLLYNDHLIWSGIEQDDAEVLYQCLTTNLLPAHLEQEMISIAAAGMPRKIAQPSTAASSSSSSGSSSSSQSYGKFIVGPSNLREAPNANDSSVPHVFLTKADSASPGMYEECLLLVYKSWSTTVCLLIDALTPLTSDLFHDLHSSLEHPLTNLAAELAEHYSKRSGSNQGEAAQLRYVYFNQMNRALKTTVHSDLKPTRQAAVPADVQRLLVDVQSDIVQLPGDCEIILKSSGTQAGDYWIVAKRADHRQLFVLVNQKNANLTEVSEEVNKLCSAIFTNMFFTD